MDLWHGNMSVLYDLLLNLKVNAVKIPQYLNSSMYVEYHFLFSFSSVPTR